MTVTEPVLRLEGIVVRHSTDFVLELDELVVRPGEFVALVGPNGSGKTTLLRAIVDPSTLEAGTARLGGDDLLSLGPRERARRIAWVPQGSKPPGDVLVHDLVLMGRTPYLSRWGRPAETDLEIVREALEQVGATSLTVKRVSEISGGELQRVLVARALAQDARVLILDEATAHLDLAHQIEVLDTCARLAHERGHVVIAAIHDLELVERHADQVLMLSKGRVAGRGSPGEVLTREAIQQVFGLTLERLPTRKSPPNGPDAASSGDSDASPADPERLSSSGS